MSSTSYEGMVGMKPELEKGHFFSGDDDFTYQVPQVYFACLGEINHSQQAFDCRYDSVIMVKDNRAVKYTEIDSYEVLLTDVNGRTNWVDGVVAEIMGWDIKDAADIRTAKSYWVEEFDWNKSEKRRYKVILEETSKLEENDEGYLKSVIDRDSKHMGEEHMLRDLGD